LAADEYGLNPHSSVTIRVTVFCLCPYRHHHLVKAVRLGVLVSVVVSAAAVAAAAAVEHAAVPQVAQREAAVVDVARVATSPDPVLDEPVAAVVVVELPRVAAVAAPAAAVVAGVVAPQHAHRAAAVALVAPDVQLSLH
jgi:hypothetical protein